jgi:ABC-type transport system involved in cytochrome c biogenesis permease subunit
MLALLAYLAAGAGSLRAPGESRSRAVLALGLVAAALHLLGMVAWGIRIQALPLGSSAGTFAFLALLVGIGSLYARRLPRMEVLEGVLQPLAGVLLAFGLVLPPAPGREAATGAWLVVHIGGMVVGVAAFTLSFGASLIWLRVRRRLKLKRLAGLYKLPSLDQLDRVNTRFTLLGFAALTVGISAGGVWAHFTGFLDLDPTIIITLLLWAWYAVAIQLRVVSGWRGQLAAAFSVVGFAVMLSCYVIIQFIYQGWHA